MLRLRFARTHSGQNSEEEKMRRSAGMNRGFAGGSISRSAMQRRGFNFGATSEHPEGLTADDGGVGSGHINERRLQQPQWAKGQGYTKQPDRPVQASNARALRGSASETWMQEWYGYPSKRQGG